MDPAKRIITEIPLRELWDERGPVAAAWVRDLTGEAISDLLRTEAVRFVVADVGAKPNWIPASDRFRFWKAEVKPHLAPPHQPAFREDFPGEYCYFASEWRGESGGTIIVLKRSH